MNRHTRWGIALVLAIALCAAGFALSGGRADRVAQLRLDFEQINDFSLGDNGNRYVVDSYRSRLIALSEGNAFLYSLEARDASFEDVLSAGDGAYLIERTAQGDVLVALDAKGRATRLSIPGTALSLVRYQGGVGLLYQSDGNWYLKPDVGGEATQSITMPEEALWMAVGGQDGHLYGLSYSGRIWRLGGEPEVLFDPAGVTWDEMCIPGDLAVDTQGRLLIANLGSRRVGYIENGAFEPILSTQDLIAQGHTDVDNSGLYRVSLTGGRMMSANGDRLLLRAESGQIASIDAASYPPIALIARAFTLIAALGVLICIARFAVIGVMALFKARMSAITGQAFQFVIFVLIFGVSVGWNLISNYQRQFDHSQQSWVRQTALFSAVEVAQRGILDSPAMSDAQKQRMLNELLLAVSDSAGGEMELSLVIPMDDSIRVLAQTVSQVPLYYPLRMDLINEGNQGELSYRAAIEQSAMINGTVVDQRGRWETCLCPVFGADGTPVALIDARIDADAFGRENQQLFLELILSASSVVVVVLFLLIEINRLMAVQMELPAAGVPVAQHRRSLVRWLGFLCFTALNIPMFFIPVQAASIYPSGAPSFLTADMAVAAPLTANMLAMAISSTALGGWVERRGWKHGVILGIALCALGYALAMLFAHILWYIGMIFLAGVGIGLIAAGLQTYIFASAPKATEDMQSDRLLSLLNSGMYAGANCGVIFGSLLADRVGYLGAFIAAVALFALAFACVMRMLPNAAISPEATQGGGERVSFVRFLLNGRVLSFLLMMLIPATVAGFFVIHFLPIYASQNGLSSTLASWGYLLNGIAIIYLGPVLTRALLSRFGGRGAVMITSCISLAGIALFTAVPVIATAFACSMLLGVADAGGQVSRQEAFLRLPQSRRAGSARALGVYSLFESIGSTIGPGIFSLILAVGLRPGFLALLVASAALFAIGLLTGVERRAQNIVGRKIAG